MQLARTADRLAVRPVPAARVAAAENTNRTRAWTVFWEATGPLSRCLEGARPEIHDLLDRHWRSFAASLAPGTAVVDLGCGSGIVARTLAHAQPLLSVTGVDVAQIPSIADPKVRILAGTSMESLPFATASLGAAVSQFGFEYGDIRSGATELARVLAPGARFCFIVHHAQSSILRFGRLHREGLRTLFDEPVRRSFLSGDADGLAGALRPLDPRSGDRTIEFSVRALLSAITAGHERRLKLWDAIVEALEPDLTLSEALEACSVTPDRLQQWLGPLRRYFVIDCQTALVAAGEPLAWKIAGAKKLFA